MPDGERVRIEGLSKIFPSPREVCALEGVDMRIGAHEFVCLVGPSGCGKSTLLNILAGFERQTEGTVLFDAHPIRGPGPERTVVFQEPALFPWLTVMRNVTFGLQLAGVPAAEQRRRAQVLLRAIGLERFAEHRPTSLSGGMKQRVGIARALIMEPKMLLMDEPFGSLDAQTRALMQELLLDVWQRYKQTVLFITHDVEEAIFLADTVYVMTAAPGRIRARVPVDLPRPRTLDVMVSPAFNDLKLQVLKMIREESRKALGHSGGGSL